ncbi:MAG: F0F1 ATP synthase subunit B [Rhizobiaceae bacterium]|nr:F0F1 ATP synthase subunit B [Rhizobiaceae bacterium]
MIISQAYAAEPSGGAFPPFDPTYFASQILWLVITFGAFYWLMSRVIIPRLAGILESRHDRISRDLDEAQRLKTEADAAHAAYEHELAEAKRNAHSIASEATDKAKQEAADAREKVEAELAEKLSEAEARIAKIKETAMGEVGAIAGDTTEEIVKQLIGGKLTKSEITKAISGAGN